MKRVSFKVAKAIKEAGYPFDHDVYDLLEYCERDINKWNYWSRFVNTTYPEVWLWLRREKKITIEFRSNFATYIRGIEDEIQLGANSDPQESLITAIEYLVENNLIK